MIGLTGTAGQVKAASKAYRTYYKVHDKDDEEFYLVDHSTMTYLMLPEHGFVEFFRRDEMQIPLQRKLPVLFRDRKAAFSSECLAYACPYMLHEPIIFIK